MAAFWEAYLITNNLVPPNSYVLQCNATVASTNLVFLAYDEDVVAFAGKVQAVRTAANPSKRMIKASSDLQGTWMDSMIKERNGILNATVEVTHTYALRYGITPHVTDRHTKRDGRLKTRIAIDGRFEIRRNKFPDKNVLYLS